MIVDLEKIFYMSKNVFTFAALNNEWWGSSAGRATD
jgi:hypothetical protein